MKYILTLCLVSLFTLSLPSFGHVSLTSSSPTKDAMLASSPETLALSFSGKVRVVKVALTNSQGNAIDFGFKPVMTPSKQHQFPLPKLAADSYQVKWVILGQDGHKMSGNLGFMVH